MTTQTEQRRTDLQSARARWKRVPFILPLVMVNVAALVGQSIWTYQQLTEHFLADHHRAAALSAVLMGLAMESISIYLSVQAHAAMMADQASGGLRLGSYLIGAVMAVINFSHFSAEPVDSVALGSMFGIASLVSPWLWAVDSRAAHRAQLAARGIVDPRGVKLSTVRKMTAPIRSLKVFIWAAWAGETDPVKAVRGWESTRQSTQTPQLRAHIEVASPSPEPVRELPQSTPVQAIESVPSESTESEEITETVTETVTRTRTRSTRTETRMQTLRDRVESVRAHADYAAAVESGTELTYDQIGSIISRTGRDVIKPVYLVLYRGQSVESIILGENA